MDSCSDLDGEILDKTEDEEEMNLKDFSFVTGENALRLSVHNVLQTGS